MGRPMTNAASVKPAAGSDESPPRGLRDHAVITQPGLTRGADPGEVRRSGVGERGGEPEVGLRVYQNVYQKDRPSSPADLSGAIPSTEASLTAYSAALDDIG